MTKQEFEAYLSKVQLRYYRKPTTIITADFFECNSGWYDLIVELIEELIKLGWNKEVAQVKEKFSILRFYIYGGSDAINTKIIEYEKKSASVCEDCGNVGRRTQIRSWYRTLCNNCENERLSNPRV